jgi:hypothetical protein
MYPKTAPASGSKDSQLMDRYRCILQTAATLREACNLQAVILIGPLRIPDTAHTLRAESLLWEAWPDWKRTTSTLCNTSHGGAGKPNTKSCASPAQESQNNGSSHKLLWRQLLGWNISLVTTANVP